MTPSTFLTPRRYQTPGGIPRRLLGGVLLVIVAVALLVYWLSGSAKPRAVTPDAQARARLEDARAIAAQLRGSTRAVDEAAERAATASRRATAAASAVASGAVDATSARTAFGATAPHDATDPDPPDPAGTPLQLPRLAAAATTPQDALDPGASARELDARAAETRVFDEPALSAGASSPEPAVDNAGPSGLAHPSLAGLASAVSEALPLPALQSVSGMVTSELGDTARRLGTPPPRDPAQRATDWDDRLAADPPRAAALHLRPPAGPLVVEQGTVIPAVLTRRIDSDTPGVVTAQVSVDVYDTRLARTLLVPKGSRLVGRYNNEIAIGQERLQFAFTRLILPDGSSFDLPGAIGSDGAGQAGLEADVDRHFLRSVGSALLIGVIADRVVARQAVPSPNAYGGGLSATGQVLVNTADTELKRNASIAPTLTIPEGTRINVEVVQDLTFSLAPSPRS